MSHKESWGVGLDVNDANTQITILNIDGAGDVTTDTGGPLGPHDRATITELALLISGPGGFIKIHSGGRSQWPTARTLYIAGIVLPIKHCIMSRESHRRPP